jgi:hypothetical protein
VNFVLDAGALIGIDRQSRRATGLLKLGHRLGATLVTSAPVVAQAWRDGARQANLARALPMIATNVVDLTTARQAGELLARAGTTDVVDAFIALLARPGDHVLTSDAGDIQVLLRARGVAANIAVV